MGLRLDLARHTETGHQLLILDVDAVKYPGAVAAFQERTGVQLGDDLDGNYRVQTGAALPDGTQPGRHLYFYVDPSEVAAQGWKSVDGLFGISGLDVKVSHVLTKDTQRQTKGQSAIVYVVLPGGTHPDSGKLYRLASEVSEPPALPDWVRDYLNAHPWAAPKPESNREEPTATATPEATRVATPALDDFTLHRFQRAVERAEQNIRNAPSGKRQGTTIAEAYGLGYLVQLLPASAQEEAYARISAASAARVTEADAEAATRDLERAWNDGIGTRADGKWGEPIEPGAKQRKEESSKSGGDQDEQAPARNPFPLYSVADMEEWPEADPIIQGIVCRAELIGLVAPNSSGKSAVALDMALHIAAGLPWNGCEVVQGASVYVAAENAPGYLRRIKAWGLEHGIDTRELPFRLVTAAMKLDGADGPRLRDTVLDAQDRLDQETVWTCVDTLRRTFGADENSSTDFSRYVDACDLVRTETGSVVSLVHHTGVGGEKRGRGSSVWGDALAPIIAVRASGPNLQRSLVLSCESHDGGKAPKDLEPFAPIHMHLRGHDTGAADRYGIPITGVVAHEGRHPDAPSQETYLDEVNRVADLLEVDPALTMDALAKAIGGKRDVTLARLHSMADDGYLSITPRKPVKVLRRPDALPGLED